MNQIITLLFLNTHPDSMVIPREIRLYYAPTAMVKGSIDCFAMLLAPHWHHMGAWPYVMASIECYIASCLVP